MAPVGAAGLGDPAAAAFDAMMEIVARHATRPLDVRCPSCPGLGAEEAALLRLVCALQGGAAAAADAIDALADWLPATLVPVALRPARRFAAAMAHADLAVVAPPDATDGAGVHHAARLPRRPVLH